MDRDTWEALLRACVLPEHVPPDAYRFSADDPNILAALTAAIRKIGRDLPEAHLEGHAAWLMDASRTGQVLNMPRNQRASRKQTAEELRALHKALTEAVARIDVLHRPGVATLFAAGHDPFEAAAALRRLAEACEGPQLATRGSARGRKPDVEAAGVTQHAAVIYETAAGRPPTFTTNPSSVDALGDWPAFLSEAFGILGIKASVNAQVRRLKGPRPSGN
jgi:hypothetical protein